VRATRRTPKYDIVAAITGGSWCGRGRLLLCDLFQAGILPFFINPGAKVHQPLIGLRCAPLLATYALQATN
jgi:hypothetical protein